MYRGFNLTFDGFKRNYHQIGKKRYEETKKPIGEVLSEYISPNNSIDGSKLQADWFPQMQAEVFISHSHKNIDDAISLAGFLEAHFGLTAFVDSCIWGYANDLLKKLDKIFCFDEDAGTYSYEQRNFSTAYVHMMLSAALTMMMDKTECVILLNTPESISSSDAIRTKTASPWIYAEVVMSQLLRRRTLESHRREKTKQFSKGRALNESYMHFEVNLQHLTAITGKDLVEWVQKWRRKSIGMNTFPLDVLYMMYDETGERIIRG